MNTFPRGPVSLLVMSAGLIVWSSCFIVLYAGMSLACTYDWFNFRFAGLHGINWVLAVLWLAHLAVLALMTWVSLGHFRLASPEARTVRFGWRITLVLNIIGLAGTAWIGFPVLMMVPCV